MKATPVVFRTWRAAPSTVLALFPFDLGTNNPGTCSSYEHVGQHGSADPFICRDGRTRPATRAEWRPLARELRRVGYRLRVLSRIPSTAYASRQSQLSAR